MQRAEVGVGAALQQEGSGVAVAGEDGRMQGRLALVVGQVHVDALVNDHVHHLPVEHGVVLVDRHADQVVEDGGLLFVGDRHVNVVLLQQHLTAAQLLLQGAVVERREAPLVLPVDVGPPREQQLDVLAQALRRRKVQHRLLVLVDLVDVGCAFDEPLQFVDRDAAPERLVQRVVHRDVCNGLFNPRSLLLNQPAGERPLELLSPAGLLL
mmetsp:Transcript_19695/g.75551  ORF Transcript_19695/g.75551 Transcript_19695/m.75551 type:complete len:210 (+) Transcript_19695:1767-2396(+)